MATRKFNPTEQIFTRIQTMLDGGVVPWHKPWVVNEFGIVRRTCGKPYSMRNRMLLQYAGEYLTFQQALKEGGCVKKGEHGSTVYLSKDIVKHKGDPDLEEHRRILWAFTVFRTDQCEGVANKYEHLWKRGGEPVEDTAAMQVVTDYCDRCGVRRIAGGSEAFYSPSDHTIQVPGNCAYESRELYWNTMFHELGHSTAKVLERSQGGCFGSSKYAREELVAEICAALCLGKLGLDTESAMLQTASYIQGWKSRIRDCKPNEFGQACHLAEQAYKLIFNVKDDNSNSNDEE